MKISLDEFNSSLDTAEERISDLSDRSGKSIQTEAGRRLRWVENTEKRHIGDILKSFNIYIWIPRRREEREWDKGIL